MRLSGGMLALALLAGSGVVAGCEARNSTGGGARGEVLETTASQSSSEDAIDVSTDSKLALSLRGSVGPIISGQTLTKATVTMSNLELVDGSGGSVALSGNGFQADILGLQNQVGQLFPAQPVKAGRYTALRFRLKNAWVVAQDASPRRGSSSPAAFWGFGRSPCSVFVIWASKSGRLRSRLVAVCILRR